MAHSIPSLRKRSLSHESEGAVLVVGLAMGLLLVGALWHIVSVGNAILWREGLQNAADAAAFENAVWNARGMNFIVFLNYIMAAVMAILVAIRGLWLCFTTTLAISMVLIGLCGVPFVGPALCTLGNVGRAVSHPLRNTFQRANQKATPKIHKIIHKLRMGQEIVATITPPGGVFAASARTGDEYGMRAVGVSASLAPTWVGPYTLGQSIYNQTNRGQNAAQRPGARNDMPRIGRGVSLPVSWDGKWKLCEEAGKVAPREIVAMFGANTDSGNRFLSWNRITDLLGGISGTAHQVFCGGERGVPLSNLENMESVRDAFQQAARDKCNGARRAGQLDEDGADHTPEERTALRSFQDYWLDDGSFNWRQCEEDKYNEARNEMQAELDDGQAQLDRINEAGDDHRRRPDPNRGKPARVWRYTANGDLFMQSWGFAWSSPSTLTTDDQGLVFAEGGSEEHLIQVAPEERGTAQAEMYFECPTDTWDGCAGNAMWLLNWRARLRRVQNPVKMAQRSLSRIAIAEVVNGLHQVINNYHGNFPLGREGTRLRKVSDFLRGHLWDSALANRGGFGYGPLRFNFPFENWAHQTSGAPFLSDYTSEHGNANLIH